MRHAIAIFASVLLLALCHAAEAQTGACVGIDTPLKPMGFETITVSTTAVGFTAASITTTTQQALAAVVSVESNPIRYRDDGTAPTSAVGHAVTAPNQLLVCGRVAVLQASFIRSGASDATLSVTYYARN